MATGQKRGNRKIGKPRQVKAPKPGDNTFTDQLERAADSKAVRGKGRG
jgi:hypothetical protein